MAIQIAQQLQVEPKYVLYLGDTGTDMQTARDSGMFALGALWGFRAAEELMVNGAKALVAHPVEVLQLL